MMWERQRVNTLDSTTFNTICHPPCVQSFTVVSCNLQIKEEISDLTKDIQKVAGQVRNCDSRLHQAKHRLDILNQRPRYELCLDNVSAKH